VGSKYLNEDMLGESFAKKKNAALCANNNNPM